MLKLALPAYNLFALAMLVSGVIMIVFDYHCTIQRKKLTYKCISLCAQASYYQWLMAGFLYSRTLEFTLPLHLIFAYFPKGITMTATSPESCTWEGGKSGRQKIRSDWHECIRIAPI